MTARQAFASVLHLFVILSFSIAGLFFVALPYLPHAQSKLIDLFCTQIEQCTQIGMIFFLIALLFLIGFYALNRGKYLVIKMGEGTRSVALADVKLIRHAVEDCFSKQFAKKITLKELEMGSAQQLAFRVSLAPLEESRREDLFIEVEKELALLLQNRFGYSKPFYLLVNL